MPWTPRWARLGTCRRLSRRRTTATCVCCSTLWATTRAGTTPWIEDCPEWYVKDERGEITMPPGFDWTDVAQLDHRHDGVQQALTDVLLYWVEEADVDGFRCDVAGHLPLNFWQEAIGCVRAEKPDVLFLAEANDPALHEVGFDVTYAWNTYNALKQVWKGDDASFALWNALAEEAERFPDHALRLRFTTNHDETAWHNTPAEDFGGEEGARAALVAAFLLPGVPLLYNGQEVGQPKALRLFHADTFDWGRSAETEAFVERLLQVRGETAGEVTIFPSGGPLLFWQRGAALVLVNPTATQASIATELVQEDGHAVLLSEDGVEVFEEVKDGPARYVLPPYGFRVLSKE